MSKFDVLWPRVREVIAFFAGLGIMFFEVGFDKGDRPWLYAAAIGMMGLPIARYLESTLGRFSNAGPQEVPTQIESAKGKTHPGKGGRR